MPKYIMVTGGVMSGLGKGITAASSGRLLVDMGYRVIPIKVDPYINIDAGTMNPFQHGEVFVLKDGTEVDLDLGHYERYIGEEVTGDHNITTGKVYKAVIEKERKGEYLGQTVQIIPHITDEIKSWIRRVANETKADVCLVEIGGTVGDIESMPFLEAIRQMQNEEKDEDFVLIHVTLVPIDSCGEQKTKPTQHSVKEVRGIGLHPDVIVCRCKEKLRESTKRKISLFCDVPVEAVVSADDADDIYEVPLKFKEEHLDEYLVNKMHLNDKQKSNQWTEIVEKWRNINDTVKIAIVGKYTYIKDAYISIIEAFKHAGIANGCKVDVDWIESTDLEGKEFEIKSDGILVPGGFGVRGTEGKINAIKYARENDIPFLGICFGFQLAVIEFARNVVGWSDANSSEFEETEHAVIDILPEQHEIDDMGGTMRLGDIEVTVVPDTIAYDLYKKEKIIERHRHRYEVNPEFIDEIKKKELIFSGYSDNGRRMEIIEYPKNKYFFATQFHPEFKSRPYDPSPPFYGFVKAVYERSKGK